MGDKEKDGPPTGPRQGSAEGPTSPKLAGAHHPTAGADARHVDADHLHASADPHAPVPPNITPIFSAFAKARPTPHTLNTNTNLI